MKKFLKTYFQIPKEGKVPDRVMTAWAVMTLLLILVYLAAMAFAAYAFYNYESSVAGTLCAPLTQIAAI